MIKRVIEISNPSWLHIKHKQLCVEQDKVEVASVPVEDIGVLVLANPAIALSQAVIIACQKNNAVVVFCDNQHLPYSVVLPIGEGHSLHHKELQQQLDVSKPTQKRLWQQVVKTKIAHQIQTLELTKSSTMALVRLQKKVKSGDPENIEAQAAQRYWRLLFGDEFRRNKDAEGINAMLNYGYAIMRALIARAIVSAGLHPALGLHHSNQYNSLCLADDLMEPFRPWVDWTVWKLTRSDIQLEVSTETKQALLGLLSIPVLWKGEKTPLLVGSHYYLARLKKCYSNAGLKMEFLKWRGQLSDQ